MKRFSEQFHIKASSVTLTAAERRALRERVVAYMEYHPLPHHTHVPLPADGESFRVLRLPFWVMARWSVAAMVFVSFTVSYVAENAVPGDVLYAVKVGFNEEYGQALRLRLTRRLPGETERLNRRLAEARVLASEGRLTGEAEEEVAQAVREHGQNVQREIAVLKETNSEDAALASLQLATTLDVQSTVLRVQGVDGTATSSPTLIAGALEAAKQETVTTTAADMPSYNRLMAEVERETTRVRELLASVDAHLTESERTDVNRRLEDSERAIADAMERAQTDESAARADLYEAIGRIQKLVVFMTNIDVRVAMDVEVIVPVVLTDAELQAQLAVEEQERAALLVRIRAAVASADIEEAVIEKAESALSAVTDLETEIAAAQAAGDLPGAVRASGDALALARDAAGLVGAGSPVTVPSGSTDIGSTTATSTPVGVVEGVSASATSSLATTTGVGE